MRPVLINEGTMTASKFFIVLVKWQVDETENQENSSCSILFPKTSHKQLQRLWAQPNVLSCLRHSPFVRIHYVKEDERLRGFVIPQSDICQRWRWSAFWNVGRYFRSTNTCEVGLLSGGMSAGRDPFTLQHFSRRHVWHQQTSLM